MATVIGLFCAPLFIGLGGWDLRSDEAIYSYAVDRILETGEWLTPRSIQVDGPFLEKPPLKFWITAALIKSGLVPQNEVGYRFADAFMGAVAFIYIYFLGWRLAGAVCGVVAVFVTFAMDAIVFEHGLRSNNMEAPLFLAYCAGMYHFVRWVDSNHPRWHALAAGLAFAFGFMTKFVAAVFLPVVWLLAIVILSPVRRQFFARWKDWALPVVVVIVAIVPWFWYEYALFGDYFWEVILGIHVYTRFTSALDPAHLEPWHYYFSKTWEQIQRAQLHYATVPAAIAALVWGRRARWHLALAMLWFVVPLASISIGTSKLYHYAYPFLPSLGLITGWAAAEVMALARGPVGIKLGERIGRFQLPERARTARLAVLGLAIVSVAISLVTLVSGRHEYRVFGVELLQNSSIVRPLVIAVVLFGLSGRVSLAAQTLAALAIVLLLPTTLYEWRVRLVTHVDHRVGVLRDCMARVHEAQPSAVTGVYNAARGFTNHTHYFYFYRSGKWIEPQDAEPEEIKQRLYDPAQQGMLLMTKDQYDRWRRFSGEQSLSLPPAAMIDDIAIVTPGPYGACASAAVVAGAQRPTVF